MNFMEIDLSDYTKVLRNQNAYKNGNINGKLTVDALSDLTAEDTETLDLSLTGNEQKVLSGNVKISDSSTNAISLGPTGGLYVQDFGSAMADVIARLGELDYRFQEFTKVTNQSFTYPDNANFSNISVGYTKQGNVVVCSISCVIKAKGSWVTIAPFEPGYKPKYIGDVTGYFVQRSANLATNGYNSIPALYCNDSGFRMIANYSKDGQPDYSWSCTVTYIV